MALSDHFRAKDWTFTATSRAAQRRNEFALYVLIASLGMFFTAGLIGYLMILMFRQRSGAAVPELDLPPIFWLSTLFAIGGSTCLWAALRSVKRERQQVFRRQLVAAFALGAAFCISQSFGLWDILKGHYAAQPAAQAAEPAPAPVTPTVLMPSQQEQIAERMTRQQTTPVGRLDGLMFVVILLHALHFGAGMLALTVVTARGLSGRYDHEYHGGVRLCALYWRFLDVVWIVLFSAFLLTS